MARIARSLLALAAASFIGCGDEPYDTGLPPEVNDIVPAWENGNLGTALVEARIADLADPTEEERLLLQDAVRTINGDFSDCESPLVSIGNRNATIVEKTDAALSVLTPPGPVSGGAVEVAVSCDGATTRLPGGYEYAFANAVGTDDEGNLIDANGEPVRRLNDVYEDEYASFALYYQAYPFINWPDPVGYGFFHSQPSPRSAPFFGQKQSLVYGGNAFDYEEPVPVPPQIPAIDFEQPLMGEELDGGVSLTFFRKRDLTDLTDPLRNRAIKLTQANPLNPADVGLAAHSATAANNTGVWLVVPFENDAGESANRYVRVAQHIGSWCADPSRDGCGDSAVDDTLLNQTRLPLDFEWFWMTPDIPVQSDLAAYADASPERVAFADCVDGGSTAAQCTDEIGLMLPTGTYTGAYLVRSTDELGSFPWESDGFEVVMERLEPIELSTGGNFVDLTTNVIGRWNRDNSNVNRILYDGFDGMGENALPIGQPVFISYEGGFFRNFTVPAKNAEMVIPNELPEPGSDAFNETPWMIVPPVEFATFFGGNSPFNPVQDDGLPVTTTYEGRQYLGFPALLPEENHFDWRISLPGGATSASNVRTDSQTADIEALFPGSDPLDLAPTYMVAELMVRDIEVASGFGLQTPWRVTAWAWAGEDYIVFPAETLATLPEIADITRPDAEDQRGSNLFGSINLEVHRVTSWELGDGFNVDGARAVVETNVLNNFYFQNQHSCFDGLDNDDDGLCDVDGCDHPVTGERLPPDPACIAASEDDDQPDSEVATCQNEEDDDGDGLIDMDDPDCDEPNDTLEGDSCADGVDNDGDGWIDLEDPGCEDENDSFEQGLGDAIDYAYSYASACNDSIDNDGDGAVDADDAGCENGADDDESGDSCGNGLDDNGDGWVDWEDLTCRPGSEFDGEVEYNATESFPFLCSNFSRELTGVDDQGNPVFEDTLTDDDGDGVANVSDPDCAFGWDESGEAGPPSVCGNGLDDDGDGYVDGDDPQCELNPEDEALPPSDNAGTCADGTDNDGDGWIDFADPDCQTGYDSEVFITGLECNDGQDNDGDGDADSDDVDCASGKDNAEAAEAAGDDDDSAGN